jgi:predicted RNase H-like nuclease (RuvC/YqgF family)
VAVLDLKGKVIRTVSARSFSISDIIEVMVETGRPIIVATDKYPPPGTVEKIKRAFNAILYAPPTSLSIEQKIKDTRNIAHSNDHERDALAAARDAFRSYKNKLEQIEKKAPGGVDLDELQVLILKGHSLESAVGLLKKPFTDVEEEEIVATSPVGGFQQQPDVSFYRLLIKRQDEQITRLVSYVKELKQTIVEDQQNIVKLTEKINFLKSNEAKRLKMSKEIRLRDKEIKRLSEEFSKNKRINKDLQRRIKTLKKISSMEIEAPLKAIRVLNSFNKDSIQLADEQFGLSNRIVLFEDASGGGIGAVDMLAEKKVKAIIVKNELSHTAQRRLFEAEIPVFSVDDLRLKVAADMVTIDRDALDQKIEEWHKETSEIKRQERAKWLESIVETYKTKRSSYSRKKSMP